MKTLDKIFKYKNWRIIVYLLIPGSLILSLLLIKRGSDLVPLEIPDTEISQYNERSNAAIPPEDEADKQPEPTRMRVAGCGLKFSFTPENKTVSQNGEIKYSLVLRNDGTESCENTSFSLYYSENESFVSSMPAPTASDYYWQVGDLAPNKEYRVSLTTKNQNGNSDQIASEACAASDNSGDICTPNIVFINNLNNLATPKIALSKIPASQNEIGIWVWESPLKMGRNYAEHMIASLKSNNINSAYITIDDYLNIHNLALGPEKEFQTNNYMQRLNDIILLANKNGIQIDVEGGEKDWAYPENRWKGYVLIDFVKAYNTKFPDSKIRGLQYDVEPYLLPEYDHNKEKVLREFVEFIDNSAAGMRDTSAEFSIVIPHFYDSGQAWTPTINYGGEERHTYSHLLKVLEKKPGSKIIVMAYRNYFYGDNGVEEIVTPEIKEASDGGYSTKVIVAQETGDVPPSFVTFHNTSKSQLINSIQEIDTAFRDFSGFGGVAIHYLEPFLQLE